MDTFSLVILSLALAIPAACVFWYLNRQVKKTRAAFDSFVSSARQPTSPAQNAANAPQHALTTLPPTSASIMHYESFRTLAEWLKGGFVTREALEIFREELKTFKKDEVPLIVNRYLTRDRCNNGRSYDHNNNRFNALDGRILRDERTIAMLQNQIASLQEHIASFRSCHCGPCCGQKIKQSSISAPTPHETDANDVSFPIASSQMDSEHDQLHNGDASEGQLQVSKAVVETATIHPCCSDHEEAVSGPITTLQSKINIAVAQIPQCTVGVNTAVTSVVGSDRNSTVIGQESRDAEIESTPVVIQHATLESTMPEIPVDTVKEETEEILVPVISPVQPEDEDMPPAEAATPMDNDIDPLLQKVPLHNQFAVTIEDVDTSYEGGEPPIVMMSPVIPADQDSGEFDNLSGLLDGWSLKTTKPARPPIVSGQIEQAVPAVPDDFAAQASVVEDDHSIPQSQSLAQDFPTESGMPVEPTNEGLNASMAEASDAENGKQAKKPLSQTFNFTNHEFPNFTMLANTPRNPFAAVNNITTSAFNTVSNITETSAPQAANDASSIGNSTATIMPADETESLGRYPAGYFENERIQAAYDAEHNIAPFDPTSKKYNDFFDDIDWSDRADTPESTTQDIVDFGIQAYNDQLMQEYEASGSPSSLDQMQQLVEPSNTEMTSDVSVPASHSVGRSLTDEDLLTDSLNAVFEGIFNRNDPSDENQVLNASVEDVDMDRSFSDVEMEDTAAFPSIVLTVPEPTPKASKKRSYDAEDGDLRKTELRGDEADEHQRSRMDADGYHDVPSDDEENDWQFFHGEDDEFYEPGHSESLRPPALQAKGRLLEGLYDPHPHDAKDEGVEDVADALGTMEVEDRMSRPGNTRTFQALHPTPHSQFCLLDLLPTSSMQPGLSPTSPAPPLTVPTYTTPTLNPPYSSNGWATGSAPYIGLYRNTNSSGGLGYTGSFTPKQTPAGSSIGMSRYHPMAGRLPNQSSPRYFPTSPSPLPPITPSYQPATIALKPTSPFSALTLSRMRWATSSSPYLAPNAAGMHTTISFTSPERMLEAQQQGAAPLGGASYGPGPTAPYTTRLEALSAVDEESDDESDDQSDTEPDARSKSEEASAEEEMGPEYEDLPDNVWKVTRSIESTVIDQAADMTKRLDEAAAAARRAAAEDWIRLGLICGGREDDERKKAAYMNLTSEGLDEIQDEAQVEEDMRKRQDLSQSEARTAAADAMSRQAMAAQMAPPGGSKGNVGYGQEQQQGDHDGDEDGDEDDDLEFEDVPIASNHVDRPPIVYPADGFEWDEDDGAPLVFEDP